LAASGTRWYDPEVALYLQPDPFGGAPVLRDTQDAGAKATASLNRYAMPGMSTFTTLGSVPGNKSNYWDLIVSLGDATANKTVGYLADEHLIPAGLDRVGLRGFGKAATSIWRQNPQDGA
jgi:hypothetical protein